VSEIVLHCGHSREVIGRYPDEHFHAVVTSPPYWGHRDYEVPDLAWGEGWTGELGKEPNPSLYIEHLVEIFTEVDRVLRPDGVVWVNIGDGYTPGSASFRPGALDEGFRDNELLTTTWRVANALRGREGGGPLQWILVNDCIWSKRNPMPDSMPGWLYVAGDDCPDCGDGSCGKCWHGRVLEDNRGTGRSVASHEYVFCMAKEGTYYYDCEAVREEPPEDSVDERVVGRHRRTVWELSTASYRGEHLAPFPEDLVRICVKASTSEGGCCSVCGAQWMRVVDKKTLERYEIQKGDPRHRPRRYSGKYDAIKGGGGTGMRYSAVETLGWRPSCVCGEGVVPSRVLDPFGGSGTTGLVCGSLGRDCVLIDVGSQYVEQARERLDSELGLLANIRVE